MLDIKDFCFDDIWLSDIATATANGYKEGYVIASIDGDDNDNPTWGNLNHNTKRIGTSLNDNYLGYTHGDAIEFSFKVLCVKKEDLDGCVINPVPMGYDGVNYFNTWLVKPNYHKAVVKTENGSVYNFNVLNTIEPIRLKGEIVGVKITCKNDSAYSYLHKTYDLLYLAKQTNYNWFTIDSNDVRNGYCLPTLKFTVGDKVGNNMLTFAFKLQYKKKLSDESYTDMYKCGATIGALRAGEQFTIDSKRKLIYRDNESDYNSSFNQGRFNFLFPKIYNQNEIVDGKIVQNNTNRIYINGINMLSSAKLICDYAIIPRF